MKTGSSVDYNQMLVVSLFLHLLVITIIMFLPKQKTQHKIIVPAFNFDVVDIPAQRKEMPSGAPKGESIKPKPEPEAPPPAKEVKEIKPEKAPAPKPAEKNALPAEVKKVETKKPRIVEDLERLEPHEPPIAKDLDQLAKLKPPETYKNLDELKKRREPPQKAQPTKKPAKKEELGGLESEPDLKKDPRIVEDLERLEPHGPPIVKDLDQLAKLKPPETYKNLDELKKRREPPQKAQPTKKTAKKEELEELESEPDQKKEPREKSALEQLEELKMPGVKSAVAQLEELRKSEAGAKKIDLAMSAGQPFSSALHKKAEVPGTAKVASLDRQADALSLYVEAIKERIYSNWKNPLGAESKEVQVSFFLFSQGSIGKPFVEKSSGNEKLDSLAVRAILDSDPFPKFPPDLKEPSLHMTIRFKYIPQD